MITRPLEQAPPLADRLRELGAKTLYLPTIEIRSSEDTLLMDNALRKINEYDWVIFTSVHGVRFFLQRLKAITTENPKSIKVAAIGPATAAALQEAGMKPDYVPDEFLSERIAAGLGKVAGKRILLPRADIASNKLPSLLRQRGALVDEIIAYNTVTPSDLTAERIRKIFSDGVDLITFTSPSTLRNLARALGFGELKSLLRNVKVACIGPVTLQAAQELAIEANITARKHTIDALIEAIVVEAGTA